MNNKPKKIFFFEGNIDGTIGGSYYLMYDLVLSLDRSKYTPIVGFHNDNILVQKLRDQGIDVYVLPRKKVFKFSFKPFNILFAPIKKAVNVMNQLILPVFRFKRFLKEKEIDMVNLNNAIVRNHSWMMAAMLLGTKCITHEMGINNSFSPLARFLGKRLEAIICLSHAIKSGMEKCGIFYPNIHVIHCGIDESRYKINRSKEGLKKEYKIGENDPIVGVVGNVKPWKGQLTIVKAMVTLVKQYPNLKCILVGDTSPADQHYKDTLIELCNESGIKDNVIFAGYQQNIIDFMNMMDIVVHTSVDPEPFGIVTLEAMICKKPLISTTIGGPAEVVITGETGLLVEAGNAVALSEAIDSLLADPEKAARMAEAGNKRLHSDFTLDKNVKATTELYDRILS